MLNVTNLIGFGAGGDFQARVYYVSTAHQSSGTNYTFSSQNLGTARGSARKILVGISSANSAAARTVSSVTIAGVSATILVQAQGTSSTSCVCAFAIAEVPSGTSGNIDVNFSGAMAQCEIFVYEAYDLLSLTPVATYTDDSAASGTRTFSSVNKPQSGFTVSVVGLRSTASDENISWSGLTEDAETYSADGAIAMNYGAASQNHTTGSTGNTITATMSNPTTNNICGVAVSMR
jgi:hypothetical protein